MWSQKHTLAKDWHVISETTRGFSHKKPTRGPRRDFGKCRDLFAKEPTRRRSLPLSGKHDACLSLGRACSPATSTVGLNYMLILSEFRLWDCKLNSMIPLFFLKKMLILFCLFFALFIPTLDSKDRESLKWEGVSYKQYNIFCIAEKNLLNVREALSRVKQDWMLSPVSRCQTGMFIMKP